MALTFFQTTAALFSAAVILSFFGFDSAEYNPAPSKIKR